MTVDIKYYIFWIRLLMCQLEYLQDKQMSYVVVFVLSS